jgi:CHAT domain-containing protein/tetratricopeptide (TPR) repeat protein
MRCIQNIGVLIVIILAGGAFFGHGLLAQTVATNSNSPTFDYYTNTYAEVTNSIQQIKQRLGEVEKASGSSNTNVADLLSDLAGLYDVVGDYAQAASLCERCLAIRQELLGAENMDVSDILDDLGWEYREMGDYEKALPLFQRSLLITEKLFGQENFDVATTMANIADVYRLEGDYAHALPLCQRALEIRQKVLGQDHPDVADSLVTLAGIYRGLGDDRKALTLCQRSIDICERRLGPDQPLETDGLFLLGEIQLDLGNYPEASSAFHHALAIDEKFVGPENPDVLEVLGELAVLFAKQHHLERSLSTSIELFKRQRHYFVGQILALSDPDALRSIQSSFQSVEIFHSVCAEASAKKLDNARTAGATELALNKALLEEVRAAQTAFEADPRTATKALREQYRAAQSQLGHLGRGGLQKMQPDTKRRELEDELSQIEAKLAERIALVAQTIRERSLTLNDIARNLPSHSALVDFIQYHRYEFAAKTNQWKEQRYAVYLTFPLAKGSTNVFVERVDLGEATPINESISLVCKRMLAGQFAAKDLSAALQQLSGLVYAPLAGYLTNASHLIICPDGQLSRVPFEMLPVGNKFLVEEKTISYVTSGREIIRLAKPKANASSSKSVVMGNPDFDFDLANAHPLNSSLQLAGNPSVLPSSSRNYDGLKFQPLPGAEAEARSVTKLLGNGAVLYLGANAREAELKAVQSPRVLHLATHGFYFPDQEFDQTRLLSYAKGSINWENPMVRCGIALAGANHAKQITNALAEDGLLTGLEASLLNLQGTELVILSACDSGNGEVKIGEGLISLRRAFLIAGAQTVLASHWNISDKATDQLMTEFIRRWQSGESRMTAWREAQLSLINSKDFSNSYFWAAFTLTGEWQ